ncbi:hypothetical protein N7499_001298 [Penicillium canescens]|uniref:Uncharacterized protein n=1 Tax=Penicillium canescens TaxID=5083 RepID=A0AAD6I468_PENCN|nr:uncharacterized protein N7446_003561 [Penicillium canescens]KAJ6008651.1 hypothetical protein N7522_003667 [Penicillium canescens]KAJ6027840.1 hypothetical protein N7460_012657 [Penicillium canescens]KAJ6041122.1 hypothetical protein N7444_010027 [Penicillium canescens]KAJ6066524.1 hypothetical protein N7446_003561 [Penicillium canescens]KAJ6101668.1 hypothetical protein N7499_001298 [Penicillium canescens]
MRSTAFPLLFLLGGALAKLHNIAVCVTNRKYSEVGGSPFSPSYTWSKDYEILPDETKCACDFYRQRNTGNEQYDQCPDCTFDGNYCNSAGWHIGGDEMTYYCEKLCHAEGAEGN